MKLIYCYIERFRNIENQEVSLSDEFECHYRDSKLLIEKLEKNPLMDYIYDNGFMSNLKIIVGKTGSGKTNFLQLIGMDEWRRIDSDASDAYLLLYKMQDENTFFAEEVGLGHKKRAYYFTYDFDNHVVLSTTPATKADVLAYMSGHLSLEEKDIHKKTLTKLKQDTIKQLKEGGVL